VDSPHEDTAEEIMARYRFWIHDKDEDGKPLDPEIVETAERVAPRLWEYRRKELRDKSTANSLLQSAVESASKAKHAHLIENPAGYLTATYRHLVDKFLRREQRIVAVDDAFLETLVDAMGGVSYEARMNAHLDLNKVMEAMDPETKLICKKRSEGWSMLEIAKDRGVTPNCLTVRYSRGLKRACKKFTEQQGGER
jgi:DNA-directed RNA polymerase specialized sigma24 family protein